MTRYLPIRKEELDLRSHVEGAGHSVDTCYQLILSQKMCKGYLVKMGGKIKSWKKRWFVFDRLKRTFSYYVGKLQSFLKGHVSMLWKGRGVKGAEPFSNQSSVICFLEKLLRQLCGPD